MPFTQPWLEVNFGTAHAGLVGTVGYRLYQANDADSVARTTASIVEIGVNTGCYGVVPPSIPDNAVGIEWDTGGGTPVSATEDLEPYRDRDEIARPGDEMTLEDDAITLAKFDEATAWPLEATDTGATEVARTGADGDTLETLSDQLDSVLVDLEDVLYMDGVYVSDDHGNPGVAPPLGTRKDPVSGSDLADAITIAGNKGLRKFVFIDDSMYTPLQSLAGDWFFVGETISVINLGNAYGFAGCQFIRCYIIGDGADIAGAFESVLGYGEFSGTYFRCLIVDDFTFSNGNMIDCTFQAPNFYPDGTFDIKNSSGNIVIKGMTFGTLNLQDFRGEVTIDATCTGGTINLIGQGLLVNNTGGTVVNREGWIDSVVVQDTAHQDGVWFSGGGEAGTERPIGTPTRPVSNEGDLRTILTARKLNKIYVVAESLTLANNYQGCHFVGLAPGVAVDINGQIVSGARFEGLTLSGDCIDQEIYAHDCRLAELENYNGSFFDCTMVAEQVVGTSDIVYMRCVFLEPTIDCTNLGSPSLYILNCRGPEIELYNLAFGEVHIQGFEGNVYLDPSCTGGSVILDGIGQKVDESGVGCTVDDRMVNPRYADGVYISSYYGVAGTEWPVGERHRPVSNMADARLIADAAGVRRYNFLDEDSYSLLEAHPDWRFEGEGCVPFLSSGDNDISGSGIVRCLMGGATNAQVMFEGVLYAGSYDMMCFRCFVSEKIEVIGGGFFQCMLWGSVVVSSSFFVVGGDGNLVLTDMTSGEVVDLFGFKGRVEIQSSCTAGTVNLFGVGAVINNGGPGVTVNTDGFIDNNFVSEETKAQTGSTSTSILTLLTQADGFFDNMQVRVEAGAGIAVRNINNYNQASGEIEVDALPFTPVLGDKVTVLARTGSVPLDLEAIENVVWDAEQVAHIADGSMGKRLYNELRAETASDVWDELIAGHLGGDKAGQRLMDAAATADPAAIAAAVWSAEFAGYTTDTQFGWLMNKYLRALIIGDAYQDQAAKQWVILDPDDGFAGGETELVRHNTYGAGGAGANARIYKRQKT